MAFTRAARVVTRQPYYDNSVQDWAHGNYYQLRIFDTQHKDDPAVKFKMLLCRRISKKRYFQVKSKDCLNARQSFFMA